MRIPLGPNQGPIRARGEGPTSAQASQSRSAQNAVPGSQTSGFCSTLPPPAIKDGRRNGRSGEGGTGAAAATPEAAR